ncbi:MAG: hypothetical protein EOP61_13330 [Sphingomonadales bacterium]|nr:MAG: hypothetical protein EOP61_13330 [Sphingomonadales bacterium]
MKSPIAALLCGSALLLAAAPAAYAHFILVAPDAWVEVNVLGDPQKAAPCGTSDITKGTPSGKVTAMTGGDMLHIKIKETIYHPGHYRVALSVLDRSELPADPEATTREGTRGPISVSGKIDPAPKPPVLADGLFLHRERPAKDSFWETDIKLPNINCDKCTVQVLQFMEEHGLNKEGEFSYHHCADLKITANPALPIDKSWPGQK